VSSSGPSTRKVKHAYFPAFDVFRGIGILFVVEAHTPIQSSVLDSLRPLGALGVHMFFALSGFLITYRLCEEFDQTGGIELGAFYKRRARRILPPAVIYLALLGLAGPVLHWLPSSFSEISASLLFYRNVFRPPLPDSWYTGHFWSLSLEEQFYLFWPWVLVLLGPRRKRTLWVALAMIAACVLWRIRLNIVDPGANLYRPDLLADHLLWGCCFGLTWNWIEARWSSGVRVVLGLAGIFAAAWLIYRQPPFWQPLFAFCVALGFICAAVAATDWAAALWPFQTMGKASYDMYIWQSLFLPLPWIGLALPAWQRAPWAYLGIAVVTSASYLLTFPRGRRARAAKLDTQHA
jgi:peptidoglycan/LPS O-acetylase OafA/YrhL